MRRIALASVCLIAALAVAGCGGSSRTDLTDGKSPAQILEDAEGATAGATAFQLNVDTTVTADIGAGAVPAVLAQALSGGVSVNGQGPINDDATTFDFEASLGGLSGFQGNVTKVDGVLTVAVLGSEYRVDLPADQVAAVTPAMLPTGLLSWIATPVDRGRETVDGVDTVHLSGEVDLDVVSRDVLNALATLRSAPVSPEVIRRSIPELRRALAERSVDVWIGTEDLLPRRITAKLRLAGKVTALPQLRSGAFDLDTRYSKYGEAVTITVPPTKEVLDVARLRSLLGG